MTLGDYLAKFEGLDPALPVFHDDRSGDAYPLEAYEPSVAWLWPNSRQHVDQTGLRYDRGYSEQDAPRKSIQGVIL